jgi:MFS family permease
VTCGFYALQVIGACAASRFGGKAVLLFAVFLWSVSTSVTPFLATSVPALIFCRVLLGLGEGLGKLTTLFLKSILYF